VPQIVVLGITRELGPVIAGLMVAGRVAAAIAAEIGTMRVTEQIDALTTLATNPIKYLVVPRLWAAVITMPILVAIADSIGVFGGYVVSTQSLNFNGAVYLRNSADFMTRSDVQSGLIKAAVFGFIIALMGCYNGFHSKGGAQGVGAATTNAVVSSSILILAANYLLTSVLFNK
jgi:phospholipid/cholesterol/gamma-HCH transport system permease protein